MTGETNSDDGGENALNCGVKGSDHTIEFVFVNHTQWQFATQENCVFYSDGKMKYQAIYSNKSEKLEEFSIDQFGVKTELFKKVEKSKKGEPKKAAEMSDEKSEEH